MSTIEPANDRLRATLTPAQWRLVLEAQAEYARGRDAEEDRFIGELARHLPGLAPTIRVLAAHLIEQKLADYGTCCSGEEAAS